jgi:ferredoxin
MGKTNYKLLAAQFKTVSVNKAISDIEAGRFRDNFVQWMQTTARTELNGHVHIYPWIIEYANLVADLRNPFVVTGGCAQLMKTLMHTLLMNYCFSQGLNVVYTFAQAKMVDRQVPAQLKPILPSALTSQNDVTKSLSSYTNSYWRYDKFSNSAYFIGMTNNTGSDGGAAQSASIVSFSADVAFTDEASQTPKEKIEILKVRLAASRLNSKPFRLLGTAGSGNGIEATIEETKLKFTAHVECKHCGKYASICPSKAFAKTINNKYHNEEALPLDHYYHNENDKIGTAYFGCEHCGEELHKDFYLDAFFYEPTTECRLSEFNELRSNCSVSLIISPLLRKGLVASKLMRDWYTSRDRQNFFQQNLGLPYIVKGNAISHVSLEQSIDRVIDRGRRSVVIMGIDQGTSGLYTTIYRYFYDAVGESTEAKLEASEAELLFADCIHLESVNAAIIEYGVQFLVCDIDPSRYTANLILRRAKIKGLLVDQRGNQQKDLYKEVELQESGVTYKAVAIRHDQIKFDLVLMYNGGRVSIPSRFQKFLGTKDFPINPMKQLKSVSYDSSEGKWLRDVNKDDDLFYASMFSLFGLRYWLDNNFSDRAREFYRNL